MSRSGASGGAGDDTTPAGTGEPAPLGPYAAAALVFGSSAAVLVVEIVALRLLAPYLGLTLETSTTVIALALAAIAGGAWVGGRLADQVPPAGLLAPLLAVSGVAVALTPVAVRAAAAGGSVSLVLVAGLSIIVPGTALAAVTPVVTKLRLRSLTETGTVVGRLSGIGTVGAIAGTVVTGFVLITRVPVSGILVGLGVALLLAAAALAVRTRGWRAAAGPAALVLGGGALAGGVGAAVLPGGCQVETAYHCAAVVADPDRPSGRLLLLDGARHSYVDLADPTHLEFPYARAMAAAVDVAYAPGRPLRAYHLGGGGLTLPRWLARTRPGSTSVVSEIDAGVVRLDRDRLGLAAGDRVEVRVEDARLGLRRLPDASQDLVVGDAFGGVSVPWHLTTREALADVARVLADDGVYVMNLIDQQPQGFARAQVATLRAVFPQVALAAEPETFDGTGGGNVVLVAGRRPVDVAALAGRLRARDTDWRAMSGAELTGYAGDAPVLTDDYAPVDQLLTPYRR